MPGGIQRFAMNYTAAIKYRAGLETTLSKLSVYAQHCESHDTTFHTRHTPLEQYNQRSARLAHPKGLHAIVALQATQLPCRLPSWKSGKRSCSSTNCTAKNVAMETAASTACGCWRSRRSALRMRVVRWRALLCFVPSMHRCVCKSA